MALMIAFELKWDEQRMGSELILQEFSDKVNCSNQNVAD